MQGDHLHRFDLLLGFIAFWTWFKALQVMRLSQTFGPMLKMLARMAQDLA